MSVQIGVFSVVFLVIFRFLLFHHFFFFKTVVFASLKLSYFHLVVWFQTDQYILAYSGASVSLSLLCFSLSPNWDGSSRSVLRILITSVEEN